ncbi:dihydrofolate reductase [Salibacterium salarium]|uniref:dihydrofolate reductase n=1 Tax=Salibacterium salarium TaxID=284579 RepID=UPI002788ABB8|nr:dihydrofolate reductase [Salibacterium salarium]MDQ0298391.1 dihydrofolate reductase [Salibacterium salarium]
MIISFVAAMDEKRVIGADNKMPWYLPNDLKHFKKVTHGNPIVMGRKTFESIGKPLPGRRNIIITSDVDYKAQGCEVLHSVEDIQSLQTEPSEEEIFVIGGATIFEQTFALASKMYLTIIHDTFSGDTYFPAWNEEEWKKLEEVEGTMDEKNNHPHTFLTLERKA